jgi:hypothetical protein
VHEQQDRDRDRDRAHAHARARAHWQLARPLRHRRSAKAAAVAGRSLSPRFSGDGKLVALPALLLAAPPPVPLAAPPDNSGSGSGQHRVLKKHDILFVPRHAGHLLPSSNASFAFVQVCERSGR